MRRVRSRIRPYPANYERSIDPVDKLGLQIALGAGRVETYYLKGRVSYQTAKLPSEVRRTGRLGESKISIRPTSRNQIDYEFGHKAPIDSIIKPQGEILDDIVDGLGLERREEALGVSIKERLMLHKIDDLPRRIQNFEPLQGCSDLYQYQTAAGDFTGVISRSLRFRRGFLRSIPRLARNELVEHGIVRANDPILGKMRSCLRTEWIIPEDRGWPFLMGIMGTLHEDLTEPYWWQDVGVPANVLLTDGGITPLNAQLYRLLRRRHLVAVQMPRDIM